MNKSIFIILVLAFFICTAFAPSGVCDEGVTYYVDATDGDDADSGTSPESAWKTIFEVNNHHFNPGDSILFKRGEVWRERLIVTNSGAPNNPISYGAYGTGAKPMLLGSVERNAESDWVTEGGNIWSTVIPKDGNELLPNPSFDESTEGWTFYSGGGTDAAFYRDTETYDSPPASVRFDCVDNNQGNGQMCFSCNGLSVTKNEWYVFSFRAKASLPFNLYQYTPSLQKSGVPMNYWFIRSKPTPFPIGTEWATYAVYFCADATADDGQIFFDLGNLPDGGSLYIDTLSFQRCDKAPLNADVGSLILNNEESVGVKVPNEEYLDTQGEFWFDSNTGQLKMYSTSNPADYYSDIECALGSSIYRDIWDDEPIIYIMADYTTIEDLDLRYGGGDGIWGQEVSNVIIRNCDISYCGGTYQHGTVRMGNGVTFWEETHDCRVEGCKIHEIYDAALSNQGEAPNTESKIYYLNNLIWNSEYSFEIWNRPEQSKMSDIYVENNVCIGAGFGWSHKQRDDPHGWHLTLWANHSSTEDIYIRNNVFYEAAFAALYYDTSDNPINMVLDYNCYYQASGDMMAFKFDMPYTMDQFSEYQSEKGYDTNSTTHDKNVVKEAARAMVRDEDINLLNELFNITDTLEPIKNEGVTLDGAEYRPPSTEPPASPPSTEPPASPLPFVALAVIIIGIIGIIIFLKRR